MTQTRLEQMCRVITVNDGFAPATATQLAFGNLTLIGIWIKQLGGAVAGLNIVHAGPIAERGIYIGNLDGSISTARIGDWIVRNAFGDFDIMTDADFRHFYSPFHPWM